MRAIISRSGFFIYWIIAVVDLVLIYSSQEQYRNYTKPFLVPMLLITVFSKIGFARHKRSKYLILLAFIAATAGDVLLLKANGFIPGLACFVVVLLFYTIYCFRIQPLVSKYLLPTLLLAAVLAAFFFALISVLWPHIQGFERPLIIYSVFLSVMFIAAVNVYHYPITKKLAINAFIPGALLFITSDVTLALNKFYFHEVVLNIIVMASYCGAQFYFARGFIKHLQRRKRRHETSEARDTAPSSHDRGLAEI
jgi:uncharacterized membrane protein YhhN